MRHWLRLIYSVQHQRMPAHIQLDTCEASPFCETDLIAHTLCLCVLRLRHRTETALEDGSDHCIFGISIRAPGTQERTGSTVCSALPLLLCFRRVYAHAMCTEVVAALLHRILPIASHFRGL